MVLTLRRRQATGLRHASSTFPQNFLDQVTSPEWIGRTLFNRLTLEAKFLVSIKGANYWLVTLGRWLAIFSFSRPEVQRCISRLFGFRCARLGGSSIRAFQVLLVVVIYQTGLN